MNCVGGQYDCRDDGQGHGKTARRAGRARVSMMCVALVVTVMETIRHHVTMHVKVRRLVQGRMLSGRPVSPEMRRLAIHRDGRKRLNRKAQCQQHDEEEFAPGTHNFKV
jgi:hypothetical protein